MTKIDVNYDVAIHHAKRIVGTKRKRFAWLFSVPPSIVESRIAVALLDADIELRATKVKAEKAEAELERVLRERS